MKEKLKMLVVMMVLLALVFALPVLAEGQDGQESRTAGPDEARAGGHQPCGGHCVAVSGAVAAQ